jgi:transcriptional regulator with XRE-family HTH domain
MTSRSLRTFGQAVRAQRERQNISQEELADRSGLHRTYIGGVERGERNIGLLNVLRIAKALKMSASDLLRDIAVEGEQ